jgi:hypothetical protein
MATSMQVFERAEAAAISFLVICLRGPDIRL